jgi:hypothetical protein
MRAAAAKLIYDFVTVYLCADVCATAQTTSPNLGYLDSHLDWNAWSLDFEARPLGTTSR